MNRFFGSLAVAAAFAVALTACGDNDDTTAEDITNQTTELPNPDETGDSATTEATGTVSFDGRELQFRVLECLQVPAEGNKWRVVGVFDGGGGYLQLDEPASGWLELDGGEEWGIANDEPMTVSADGAHGTVTMLPEAMRTDPNPPEATLDVSITC